VKAARRLQTLPPYMFAELDRRIETKRAEGVDVISLGVGDPDQPTPRHIVEALQEAAEDPTTHQYPSYWGLPALRKAIADWYGSRFGVDLDPDTEVLPLIGSKEGIAHLAWAFVDPGDEVLVPDPGYPVYAASTLLAGGTPVPLPVGAERGWAPDLSEVKVTEAARVLWLNYPSNPTAAVADDGVFEEAVDFARGHNLLLAHDAAYVEMTFDGYVAPSLLQVEDARDVAVEFGSPSKTYNMTGWRVGWVCGSPVAIEAIKRLKTNIDSGIFDALQRAGIAALRGPQDRVATCVQRYARRRDLLCDALKSMGLVVEPPKGSIYLWVPVPEGHTSESFTAFLLDQADIVVAPGNGYGAAGEGYVRFSLTVSDDRLEEGVERLRKVVT
jgi:LL-diaminopimelate aminotransferase